LWLNDGSCIRLRPQRKDHVWAYDFVSGRTHDGAPFKMLTIVDEFTREYLAIDVSRKLTSDDELERLAWLMATRGVTEHIRSDNGPEFTAGVVRDWLGKVGVKTLFIEPGSPWENGYVESFNGKLRDELLEREIFYSLEEAKVLIEMWRKHYNTVRPHSALGYKPPAPESICIGMKDAGCATGAGNQGRRSRCPIWSSHWTHVYLQRLSKTYEFGRRQGEARRTRRLGTPRSTRRFDRWQADRADSSGMGRNQCHHASHSLSPRRRYSAPRGP
jgi:hypothetical protein